MTGGTPAISCPTFSLTPHKAKVGKTDAKLSFVKNIVFAPLEVINIKPVFLFPDPDTVKTYLTSKSNWPSFRDLSQRQSRKNGDKKTDTPIYWRLAASHFPHEEPYCVVFFFYLTGQDRGWPENP